MGAIGALSALSNHLSEASLPARICSIGATMRMHQKRGQLEGGTATMHNLTTSATPPKMLSQRARKPPDRATSKSAASSTTYPPPRQRDIDAAALSSSSSSTPKTLMNNGKGQLYVQTLVTPRGLLLAAKELGVKVEQVRSEQAA